MLASLVKKIAEHSGVTFDPVVFKPRLDEITAQLPSIPPDLQEYLDECLLAESFGNMVEFHGFERLLEENEALLPGADTITQGFLCIAKEPDGSQFAYYCQDKKIYHIPEEAGASASDTVSSSYIHWNSLQDFLIDCIQMTKNPDRPIGSTD